MYLHCIYYLEEEDMETRVQKWGNSLALRIPKPLAVQIGLEPNSPVELSLRGKELVIQTSYGAERWLIPIRRGHATPSIHHFLQ